MLPTGVSPGPTRRPSVCWRIALAALCLNAGCLGDGVAAATVEVTRHGREFAVAASADVRAGVEVTWSTLTDYEALPRFLPNVKSARVLRRSQVDGLERLLVEQRGEFRYLFFAHPVTVRLDVVQRRPERVDARAVAAPGDDGTFLEYFEGRYDITPSAAGARVNYRARIVPREGLPPVIGTLAVRWTVRQEFEAMMAEIERRGAQEQRASLQ